MREGVPTVSARKAISAGERKLGLGILAVVLALTLGCSSDDIMGPGSVALTGDIPGDGSGRDASFAILADPDGMAEQLVQGEGALDGASTLVTADKGGVVAWGRFRLEIPAGALSEDTVIEISRPDRHVVRCELGPHGLQFNKPVTLQINYEGTSADGSEDAMPALGVYWFNEDAGRWELVGKSVDSGADKMEAELEHFSDYTAGWIP